MNENADKPPIMLRLALWTQAMHVAVVALIVVCTAGLSASGHLSDQSATAVFGTALGYAGGAAASRAGGRVTEDRKTGGHL